MASLFVSEDGWEPPGRVRSVLHDLAAYVLYVYVGALPAALGLGWLSNRGDGPFLLSLALSAVAFLGLGFGVFVGLLYEEDWWDDFHEQNRAMLVFASLHLFGLPVAWVWGRSIGG